MKRKLKKLLNNQPEGKTPDMLRHKCSMIGFISKPHGAKGDLIIRLKEYDTEFIEPEESIFVEINGLLIPFFISEITPKGNMAVIHLKRVDSLDEAKKLVGKNIFMLTSSLPHKQLESELNPNIFTGFEFIDQKSNMQGKILEYIDNPNNPLFLVISGTKEFLIPAHPEIILEADMDKRIIKTELPEGIADL
jgi:16S rRNA processing protein RimM